MDVEEVNLDFKLKLFVLCRVLPIVLQYVASLAHHLPHVVELALDSKQRHALVKTFAPTNPFL